MISAAKLEQTMLLPSRMLHPHSRFYVREMRILAYNQLLQSYRSLTLDSMARSFGVSIEFIDTYVPPSFSYTVPAEPRTWNQGTIAFHRVGTPALHDRQGRGRRRDEPARGQERAVRDRRAPGRRALELRAAVE